MKKSNWLIAGLLVVASVIFLAMWYVLGFNLIDDPLDLIVSIVWWVVIIAVCLLIQWSENKRQRSIRTTLLAPGVLYNPEVGVVEVAPGQTHAQTLERILSNLTYGFDTEKMQTSSIFVSNRSFARRSSLMMVIPGLAKWLMSQTQIRFAISRTKQSSRA